MKRKRIRNMVNVICCYGDVMADKHNQSLGYLVPLRCSCPGPVRLDFSDSDSFTVGRGLECTFVLPEQMFEEEENLNHNKEVSKIKIFLNYPCSSPSPEAIWVVLGFRNFR